MAAIEQDSDRFSLGQIWSDKRYRAVLTQILVVAGVFFFIAFLAMNAVANLEQLGKTFGFGFLWAPASYDINQALISYTSRDPHFRAAVVGLFNTGLIARSEERRVWNECVSPRRYRWSPSHSKKKKSMND